MTTIACRSSRAFLTLTSIVQATTFINATTDTEIDAQMNTSFRAMEMCEFKNLNQYNATQ